MYYIQLIKKDENYHEETVVTLKVMSRDLTMMREELTQSANRMDQYFDLHENNIPNVGPVS